MQTERVIMTVVVDNYPVEMPMAMVVAVFAVFVAAMLLTVFVMRVVGTPDGRAFLAVHGHDMARIGVT